MLLFIYALAGVLAGIAAGLFGLGGGVVLVPIFIHAFHYEPNVGAHAVRLALATSMAVILVTSALSVWRQQQLRHIQWPWVTSSGLSIVLCAPLGGLGIHYLPSHFLKQAFAVFLMVVAVLFLLRKPVQELKKAPSWWALSSVNALIALVASLFGIGGGALWGPWLLRFMPPKEAVGTVSACTLLLALTQVLTLSLISFFSSANLEGAEVLGYVFWPAFVSASLGSFVGTAWGVKWLRKISLPVWRSLFAGLLVMVAVLTLFN